MSQIDDNTNEVMVDPDLIDVDCLDFSNDQTWLCRVSWDSGKNVDILEWNLACEWPAQDDEEYFKTETEFYSLLDNILKNGATSLPDKHKFDSRTFVKPKKRVQRPSIIQTVAEGNQPIEDSSSTTTSVPPNKYLTYNKYNSPITPILRLKTFNVDTNTDNSAVAKGFTLKRKSIAQDDYLSLEDMNMTLASASSLDNTPVSLTKPIHIDLSQPATNLHNTFNKGLTNILNERGSLPMYQSNESIMRMSPPSLVSSLMMESSGTFNNELMDSRKSINNSGMPSLGRESLGTMMTSMNMSILDEKDMNTSFLSQTTYPDNDSLIGSLPPSLVSSINSSFINSNSQRTRPGSTEPNVFSSATFTHLDQLERPLLNRPKHQLYNSFTRRDSSVRNSESYTKSREEGSQYNTMVLSKESADQSKNVKAKSEMSETVTLHFANGMFGKIKNNESEKENLNITFEKDDTFYKDMDVAKSLDPGTNNAFARQELNEIVQARERLSQVRKNLPNDEDKKMVLPNQVDHSPNKTIQLPNQTIKVPKHSLENASELLSRRRGSNIESYDNALRESPKRSSTFKKSSPKSGSIDATLVHVKTQDKKIIDIDTATFNMVDADTTLQPEDWEQSRAMVGSNESTDTGTFSSSSPADSFPDSMILAPIERNQVASTPVVSINKNATSKLFTIHNHISPIYDIDDNKYPSKNTIYNEAAKKTNDLNSTNAINTATIVRKHPTVKRSILVNQTSPERKGASPEKSSQMRSTHNRNSPTNTVTYTTMPAPLAIPRKTGLPTSKLRQYSSHKELNIIPSGNTTAAPSRTSLIGRGVMTRRGVYASNPALSPTAPAPSAAFGPPVIRRDSYTVAVDAENNVATETPSVKPTPALVRQGTETLQRPQSHLQIPRELRPGPGVIAAPSVTTTRNSVQHNTGRPYSIAGTTHLRPSRPNSGMPYKAAPVSSSGGEFRPTSAAEGRASGLPRPSRLPAPRRPFRPSSVYSIAPTDQMDHY